ncbi:hydroquinone glucosyltransferase-like [Nymphaea colorata]|uniref:hydroquinone glucosyltransferase-like n=1 Tax=Nymphaea colorata TaxID=210225 RepID=UPI00129E8B06|nr:hydroquinone glucosyltransferase-like [Nymphaea colorata]
MFRSYRGFQRSHGSGESQQREASCRHHAQHQHGPSHPHHGICQTLGLPPQVKVLSHEAVGGFLSHCRWKSSLESVVYGVPMIGWPLYPEQRMNARMLADEIGISVSVDYEKGLVHRGEVERVVRLLMESEVGKKLRKRVGELKEAASQALAEEGSSSRRLALLADQWANTKPSARLDRS